MVLSIILQPSNSGETLQRCIDSICTQSLTDIEVLCPDKNLLEPDLELIGQYQEKDARIRIIPCKDVEDGYLQIHLLNAATGEYVHVISWNDSVLDYSYEALIRKAIKYNLDCIKFCAVEWDDSQGCTVKNPELMYEHFREGDFNRILDYTEGMRFQINSSIWSGIFRRSFIIELCTSYMIDSESSFERLFYARLLTSGGRIAVSRDVLIIHHTNRTIDLLITPEDLRCQMSNIRGVEKVLLACNTNQMCFNAIMEGEFQQLLEQFTHLPIDTGPSFVQELRTFLTEFRYDFMRSIWKQADHVQFGHQYRQAKRFDFFRETCTLPKVSVVVPIYNQEDYLNQALFSLVNQTLKDIEFLCVNDGSTDSSMAILKEYASIDRRIRIIDKPNSGYGHSMNVGIDAARGEYLGILEPDDFVPADMFQKLYERAKEQKVDLIKADFYRFSVMESGEMITRLTRLTSDESYYGRILCPVDEPETFRFVNNTWSGIYALSFLNRWNIRHHETPGASYQDNGFWFQTFCRAERVWFEPSAFYMYRKDNPNSSMFSKNKFYTLTEEYRFIYEWLSKDPELLNKIEPVFYQKKLHALFVNYYRLAPELKRDYLVHICDEFREPVRTGKLLLTESGDVDQKLLKEIFLDPDGFENKVRISVIIPFHNSEKDARTCLDSLLVRSEIRFEVICVDDGSTDNTLSILKEYEMRDHRVRVITQSHSGPGIARNLGMKHATGEYIAFFNQNAFFEPDALRKAFLKAFSENSDIVIFRSNVYFEEKKQFGNLLPAVSSKLLPDSRPFAGSDIERNIFNAFVGPPLDKLFKSELIREKQVSFQDTFSCSDYYEMVFVYSALIQAERISLMNNCLIHYRKSECDGNWNLPTNQNNNPDDLYNALIALRTRLLELNLYSRYERDFINFALHLCICSLNEQKGKSYYYYYDKLKKSWFGALKIIDQDALYIYDEKEYAQYSTIQRLEAEEYIFSRLDYYNQHLEDSAEKNKELRKRVKTLSQQQKNINCQIKTLSKENKSLEVQVKSFSQEKKTLEVQLNKAKKQNSQQKKRTDALLSQKEKELKDAEKRYREEVKKNRALRSSLSYRIGRMITWLPRRLRFIIRA